MAIEGGEEGQQGNESTLLSMLVAQLAERDAAIADREAMLAERDAAIVERDTRLVEVQSDQERLRRLVETLKLELQLLKRRMFIAKAERVDTTSLQLEFEDLVGKLDALSGLVPSEEDESPEAAAVDPSAPPPLGDPSRGRPKPKGRRNLADAELPEERVEIADDLFEDLVAQGKAERIDHETSYKLSYRRGGFVKLVIARVKYRAVGARGVAEIETAPMPPELLPRCLASASTLAKIATAKFSDGMPLYRQQEILAREGATVDRGTMSRWLEQLGGSLGPTIIEAMDQDLRRRAFCILTDATGFLIQPGPRDGPRRPCRRGHYFVRIADRDHILFSYTAKHDSATVRAMFKGYEGYLQLDAASIYDVLFRPPDPDDPDSDGCIRIEVACWSHARRKYWEAALAKERVAREALVRIGKIFELDARFRKGNPPSKIKKLRHQHLRPLVEELLDFAQAEYEKVKNQRGSLRSALGYTVRQADAMRAFLDDGRLRLDNNPSEGQLRKVVRIRDASLFAGSDDHAESAGHILSLIASAKLHGLDPERYLRDIIRVLPFWPRERFLELAPKYWAQTRARLDGAELEREVGTIAVPDSPLPDATQ